MRDFVFAQQGPGTDVVDQRAVQSMPHGMLLDCSPDGSSLTCGLVRSIAALRFSQCLQEEKENAPSPIIGSDSGGERESTARP